MRLILGGFRMSLTLVTNPVGYETSKIFAGFLPIEYVFKREDLAITGVTSGTGGAKITVATDLSSYLIPGDTLYVYSPGTNYNYNLTATILTITSTEITIDAPYIETGTGGYINYFKNYYVDFQCVHKNNPLINLLPFNIQSDGDASGNVVIDVSIMNDKNRQRPSIIVQGLLSNSVQEFEIQYRQVYQGSSESFTLIDNKLLVVLYATETPEPETILNKFDLPKLYLGYPAALCVSHSGGSISFDMGMPCNELDINQQVIVSSDLGDINSGYNGFLLWKWPSNASVNEQTKYLEFLFSFTGIPEYHPDDYDLNNYKTT
jgi:hypothetical protein